MWIWFAAFLQKGFLECLWWQWKCRQKSIASHLYQSICDLQVCSKGVLLRGRFLVVTIHRDSFVPKHLWFKFCSHQNVHFLWYEISKVNHKIDCKYNSSNELWFLTFFQTLLLNFYGLLFSIEKYKFQLTKRI